MDTASRTSGSIRPSTGHPGYWDYRGATTLLIGGSREDNLFQIDELEEHLDALAVVGGNYIRNTMSDRDDGDVYAFHRIAEGAETGKYDLDRWNPEYWNRFTRLLDLCREREIVVQIEVWDRFDLSRQPWLTHPWNPRNNVTYDSGSSGLATQYPNHPSGNEQPFFHTVPAMDDNALLRGHQERFVDKLLSISLAYPNVLYCMNNETHEEPAWGRYWLDYIRRRAREAGTEVVATDMFDGPWEDGLPEAVVQQFAEVDTYPFIDVSQVNAWRCTTEQHWSNLRELGRMNRENRRPLNCTKVYNSDTLPDRSAPRHTDRDGIVAFWLDLLGGCASARFHRPPHGLGLSAKAVASIRSARAVEHEVRFWDLSPRFDWTGGRKPAEAFLADNGEDVAVVLLPLGGEFTAGPHVAAIAGTGRCRITVYALENGEVESDWEVELNETSSVGGAEGHPKVVVIRR